MTSAEIYVRESLRLFAIDPPDNEYQHGFLEALLVLGKEGIGMADTDPDIVAAKSANRHGSPLPPQIRKLAMDAAPSLFIKGFITDCYERGERPDFGFPEDPPRS